MPESEHTPEGLTDDFEPGDDFYDPCSHCGGEGDCTDGVDPLGNCGDEPHRCHACGGSGRADIEFWLRPDVPVWRYSKDELLEQHREVTAGLQAKREGEGTMRALPGDWITR